MDAERFADFLRDLTPSPSRRGALRRVAGLALAGLLGLAHADAKKKKKKKKTKKKTKKAASPPISPPSPPPPPPPFTRIECAGPSENSVLGVRRWAQTFVANGTGTISTAEMELGSVPAGADLAFEIRAVDASGAPTGTVLGTALLLDQPAAGSPTTVTATFNLPVPVVHGTEYALAITFVSTGNPALMTRSSDDCAGTCFFDSFADGTFAPSANADLIFAVAP